MIETWIQSDISDNTVYGGDLQQALRRISARTLLMPGRSDLYFTEDDCRLEAQYIASYRVEPLISAWGHRAGNPLKSPADADFIRNAVHELLQQ
jgi:homoserine O-acetyltransferase